jgi:hypothetical protein
MEHGVSGKRLRGQGIKIKETESRTQEPGEEREIRGQKSEVRDQNLEFRN